MKRFATLIFLLVISCGKSNFEDSVYLDFDQVKCWVVNYETETSEEDLLKHAEHLSNPMGTTYVYYYPQGFDVSVLQNAENQTDLISLMEERLPDIGFMIIEDKEPQKLEMY